MYYTEIIDSDNYKKLVIKEIEDEVHELMILDKDLNLLDDDSFIRMKLVAWGYCINQSIENVKITEVIELAAQIELLNTVTFSEDATRIKFNSALVKKIMMNCVSFFENDDLNLDQITRNVTIIKRSINAFSQDKFCQLIATDNTIKNISTLMSDITDKESTFFIRDSLVLGYLSGKDYDDNIFKTLHEIGEIISHILKVKNDIKIINNYSADKLNRKCISSQIGCDNIVISTLSGVCSTHDKERLNTYRLDNEGLMNIVKMRDKYNINEYLLEDLDYLWDKLTLKLEILSKTNKQWAIGFKDYISQALTPSIDNSFI